MKFICNQLLFGLLFLLAACGDTVENVYQNGMGVVASEGDLPECTSENDGEMAFVKGKNITQVCVDGDWAPVLSKDSAKSEFICNTEELDDKSGLKVVCNGDSIGVVLNGEKGDSGAPGEDGTDGRNGRNGTDGRNGQDGTNGQNGQDGTPGQAGTSCSLTDKTETTVTIVCGDSTMVIYLGSAIDDDTSTIGMVEMIGYTQKGPFLKGSSVYLYELNGTLGQTNGNFTSVITTDDGRYKFRTRGLKYPYAMVVVDGYYRNEVTGKTSDAPIRLRAITDVSGRVTGSVNVNLLTHLEYERVVQLATGPGKLKLKEAKRKAQKEILAQFYIDTTKTEDVHSEDMNVFGSSEADAELLAISILLQGNGTASDLSTLLTQIVADMAEDGEWDSTGSAATRVHLADMALAVNLPQVRKNVEGWGLSDGPVGNFERIVNNYIAKELFGGDTCGNGDDGAERVINNSLSANNGKVFYCAEGMYGIPVGNKYFNENVEYGYLLDKRDMQVYRTVKIGDQEWMAENLNYEYALASRAAFAYESYKDQMCSFDSCKVYGHYYLWSHAMDSAAVFSDNGKNCGYGGGCSATYPVRGICPEGWHLPDTLEWSLFSKVNSDLQAYVAKGLKVYDSDGTILEEQWPDATNETGFTALPASYWDDSFRWDKNEITFWSSTYYSIYNGLTWNIMPRWMTFGVPPATMARPIRCIKDASQGE